MEEESLDELIRRLGTSEARRLLQTALLRGGATAGDAAPDAAPQAHTARPASEAAGPSNPQAANIQALRSLGIPGSSQQLTVLLQRAQGDLNAAADLWYQGGESHQGAHTDEALPARKNAARMASGLAVTYLHSHMSARSARHTRWVSCATSARSCACCAQMMPGPARHSRPSTQRAGNPRWQRASSELRRQLTSAVRTVAAATRDRAPASVRQHAAEAHSGAIQRTMHAHPLDGSVWGLCKLGVRV